MEMGVLSGHAYDAAISRFQDVSTPWMVMMDPFIGTNSALISSRLKGI
jgi:hypothetical protein